MRNDEYWLIQKDRTEIFTKKNSEANNHKHTLLEAWSLFIYSGTISSDMYT